MCPKSPWQEKIQKNKNQTENAGFFPSAACSTKQGGEEFHLKIAHIHVSEKHL